MVSPVFWRFSPGLQSSKGVMSKGGKTEMGCDIGMKSTSLNFTQFHFSDFSDFSDFSAAMSKPCPAHQDVMIADIIGGFPGGHLGTSRDRWDQRFGASASRISSRGMTNNQCMVIFFNNQTQHDLFEWVHGLMFFAWYFDMPIVFQNPLLISEDCMRPYRTCNFYSCLFF